ncbi:MAG: PD40 domain-containing protein [Verrucomicrobiales bacterium]|nr:PD40 domain-containing protein [Verrucomicrobiales bacterium]
MNPTASKLLRCHLAALTCIGMFSAAVAHSASPEPLATELHRHGWIAFSLQTDRGDWDLVAMRPDGSERHALTDTPEFNEAGVRFSPDGQRLLYYRMAKSDAVDNNTYGTFELILAHADGSHATNFGRGYPWASWGPDGRQLATLTPKGVQIIDVTLRAVVRTIPRQGIVQQLIWSPDGRAFTGTANGLGAFWNIAALPESTGPIRAISETERYNCTPDWCPDSRRIVYARGIIPQQPGRAELWVAETDGKNRAMVYAETERHVYGACPSPDGKYLLFTRSVADLGAVGKSQTTLSVVRWADTPMRGDDSAELRQRFPDAKPSQRLDLGPGWEPHWTLKELPGHP